MGLPPEPVVWMPPASSGLTGPVITTLQAYQMQAHIDGIPDDLAMEQDAALDQLQQLATRIKERGLPVEGEGVSLFPLTAADIKAILKLAKADTNEPAEQV